MSGEGGVEKQVGSVDGTSPALLNTATTTTTTTTTALTTTTSLPTTTASDTTTTTTTPSLHHTDTTTTTATPLLTSPPPGTSKEDEDGEDTTTMEEGGGCAVVVVVEQVHLTTDQLATLSKQQLVEKWLQQEKYVQSIHTRMEALEREVEDVRVLREGEERLKGQLAEVQRKEQYHIMRLSCKEHEIQDMGVQVHELKNMSAGVGGLKHCLLDPAVNLLFERLKRDLDTARTKMEETQNELSAWKFTPDSNTGKQLMAKCRLLIKENEELGRMITSGRLAKLEGDLALQKNFSEELKKSQSELDEFLLEMDEDTEGMQGTIYYLQQQLRQAKERIAQLTAQVALSTSDTHAGDGSAQVVTEGPSELSTEGERTEERTLMPQPNGDARTNSELPWDVDDSAAPPLTNGRKRTQSEIDELPEGSVSEAEGVAPYKRTRVDFEEDGGAGVVGGIQQQQQEAATAPVVENGVMEAE